MLKGNYSCNRAVIFEVAIFLLLSLFWTNHLNHNAKTPTSPNHLLQNADHQHHLTTFSKTPTTNHQPPSPQNASHATITPTTNHFLHHANHQSPSPQPPNHTTITTTTNRQPRHHYKQPCHVNHNLHNHTTAFPPRRTVARSLAFV